MPKSTEPISAIARPVFWTMGLVAGFLNAALTPADVRRRQALRRWKSQWRRSVRQNVLAEARPGELDLASGLSLTTLQQAMLGRSRADVVAALGPPLAASAVPQLEALPPKPAHYWHAHVWYYPIDVHRHRAVAFIFEDDIVSAIEQLTGPR